MCMLDVRIAWMDILVDKYVSVHGKLPFMRGERGG
jgi:hypothetical protein